MCKKLLNGKMMTILAGLLILFMAIGVAEASRMDFLDGMYVMEGRGIGGMSDIAQTPDGTLFTAFTYDDSGTLLNWEFDRWVSWAVFLDSDNNEVWSLADAHEDGRYLRPTVLPEVGFALFHQQGDDLSMLTFDRNGHAVGERPLPSLPKTQILSVEDGTFVTGNTRILDEDGYEIEGLPFLARFGGEAEPLWSLEYPHEYALRWFKKAVYAMDSLIISAITDLDYDAYDSRRGSLYRMDLDGNVMWNVTFDPELGDETYTRDVCVSEDNIIAVIVDDWAYNEDYGYNIDRLSSVVALNMDGEILWRYKLNNGVSNVSLLFRDGVIPYRIVPVDGGFLCAGPRINTETSGSGFTPFEWVLFLDKEGNAKGEPVDMRDDRVELESLAYGAGGKAILYGRYIEGLGNLEEYEYGDTPGKPFFVVLGSK